MSTAIDEKEVGHVNFHFSHYLSKYIMLNNSYLAQIKVQRT